MSFTLGHKIAVGFSVALALLVLGSAIGLTVPHLFGHANGAERAIFEARGELAERRVATVSNAAQDGPDIRLDTLEVRVAAPPEPGELAFERFVSLLVNREHGR